MLSVVDSGGIRNKKAEIPLAGMGNASQELIAHYENQTEDAEIADIEAAREAEDITIMAIPTELVPEVRVLLARNDSACQMPNPM